MSIVLKQNGKEQVVLENAALLEVVDDGIRANALFEQPKLIQGVAITGIDFLQGKVSVSETKQEKMPEMNPKTTLEKLRFLLPHWIEHSQKHGVEFKQWAAAARAEGGETLAALLDKAVANMAATDELLKKALADAGGAGGTPTQSHYHPHDHDHDHGPTSSLPKNKNQG
jgi:predicted RNA-binding protein